MRSLFAALLLVAFGIPSAGASILPQPLVSPQGENTVGPGLCLPIVGFVCIIKTFNTLDPIELEFEVETQTSNGLSLTLSEQIINNTGIPWTDFHWSLEIVTGSPGATFDCCEIEPVDLIGLDEDDLSCMEDCTSTDLTGILLPDSGSEFLVSLTLGAAAEGTFKLVQYPTVPTPEPTTLVLFAVGVAGIGFATRRREATTV